MKIKEGERMKTKHKVLLTILVIITVVAFILFNMNYKDAMLSSAIQDTSKSNVSGQINNN